MPFCEVAVATKLYYEDFGEGPALVFTPSGSLTHKMWSSQAQSGKESATTAKVCA